MLAPVSARKVRKVIKRHRRMTMDPCPRGALLRRLIGDSDPSVAILRPTPEEAARAELINAGVAYCLATCGGCALTDEMMPPA